MRKIFVFGSNTQGIHGAGAALSAKELHGAIQGVPMGLQGNAYGIVTKHLPGGERSVPLNFIESQIKTLFNFAHIRQDLLFNVTRIGCGHAGFLEGEIAPFFNTMIPTNMQLCPEFNDWLHRYGSL